MEIKSKINAKANKMGQLFQYFTLGTANSACSAVFYARIWGTRANPLKYTDPDGKSPWPFGFTFDPIGEIKDFLSQFDPGLKLTNIFTASNNNQAAQAYSKMIMEGAARDFASNGSDVASNLSMAANVVSVGASAGGAPHVAAGAFATAFVFDSMALGLSILAEDEDKTKAALLSFGIDLGFKALGSKASPLAKFFPGWSNISLRYRNSTNGQFVSNAIGRTSNTAQTTIGIAVGIEAAARPTLSNEQKQQIK
jgi:hypothetical protein